MWQSTVLSAWLQWVTLSSKGVSVPPAGIQAPGVIPVYGGSRKSNKLYWLVQGLLQGKISVKENV